MSEIGKRGDRNGSVHVAVCPERDADLLLMAHGELSTFTLLRTKVHMFLCSSCRARSNTFAGVSQSVALAIRTPLLPKWSPYNNSLPMNSRRLPWLVAALFLLSTLCMVTHLTASATSTAHPCASAQSRSALPIVGGCPLHSRAALRKYSRRASPKGLADPPRTWMIPGRT